MKKIALFDWDYTVRKNHAYDLLVDTLVENKIIDKKILKINEKRWNEYLNDKITHDQLAESGIEVYR